MENRDNPWVSVYFSTFNVTILRNWYTFNKIHNLNFCDSPRYIFTYISIFHCWAVTVSYNPSQPHNHDECAYRLLNCFRSVRYVKYILISNILDINCGNQSNSVINWRTSVYKTSKRWIKEYGTIKVVQSGTVK